MKNWGRRYAALAARHRDSVGRPPQHTFFYPGEQLTRPLLETLQHLAAAGLGDVELHFHHDHDTAETLRRKRQDAIGNMEQYGFLRTIDGKTAFAFIHGNSGLDNSNGKTVCGVNRELGLAPGSWLLRRFLS